MDLLALQLTPHGRALTESFYFRGLSPDGSLAFVLQHNLLRLRAGRVRVESALMAFDRKSGEAQCIYDREEVSPQAFRQFSKTGSWGGTTFNFNSGSFFDIGTGRLRGKLHTPRGSAAWDFQLHTGDTGFLHLPSEASYRLPLPSHKRLSCDTRLLFRGRLSCAGMVLQGEFSGVSTHGWSRGLAAEFAQASCHRFKERPDAYFEGCSARMQLAGGWLQSPYFSMASLRLGEQWHHFNQLLQALRHPVDALDNYRWLLTLSNDSHRLEVAVDGANPRVEPWLALHYDQPGGQRRVVKNTAFAAGKLRLYAHGSSKPLQVLSSEGFSLETCLPGNLPSSRSFVGLP